MLLHDNAQPHSAALTAETLGKLKFDVVAHPSYSPDLEPCDHRLFVPLKWALWSRQLTLQQEVKEVMWVWPFAQLKTFPSEGR
jgi:hypothetical protein